MILRAPPLLALAIATLATCAHAQPDSRFRAVTRGGALGVHASYWLPSPDAWSLGLRSNAGGFLSTSSSPTAMGEALACLGWTRTNTTLWIGAGAKRPAVPTLYDTQGIIAAGAEVRGRALRWTASTQRTRGAMPRDPYLVWSWTSPPFFQAPPDTFPTLPYWETPGPADVSVTTFETALEWRRSAWDVSGALGVSVGPRFAPMHATRFAVTRWVVPSFGVRVGAQAAAPRWLTGEPSEVPRYEFGVSFEPGRKPKKPDPFYEPEPLPPVAADRRWEFAAQGDGVYALRVRAPGANAVSVRGDFTQWEWIALAPEGDGWFVASHALEPGMHQIEVAIDGAPADALEGLARGASDYGRAVGVFVVE